MWLTVCVLLPVLIALAWGDVYVDEAYAQFAQASAWARAEDAAWLNVATTSDVLLRPHAYFVILALAEGRGLPLPTVALVLSVIGWVMAIVTWFFVGVHLEQPLFSVAIVILLALHPLHPQVLGTEVGLTVGVLGFVALAAVFRPWLGAVALIPLAVIQPVSALLALLFVSLNLFFERKSTSFLVVIFAFWSVVWLLLARETNFQSPCCLAMLWMALQLFIAAVFARLVPNLAWLARPDAGARTLLRGSALVVWGGLVVVQCVALVQAWNLRPVERLALYKTAAAWLSEYALPEEAVATQQPGVVAYFADRDTVPLAAERVTETLATLQTAYPAYVLTVNSLVWQGVCVQPWFQARYQPVYERANAYDTAAPLTLFRYTPSPFDAGDLVGVWRTFMLDPRGTIVSDDAEASPVELLEYRLSSTRITPDSPLYLTLYWNAQLLTLDTSLTARVQLVSPETRRIWSQAEATLPDDVTVTLWDPERLSDQYRLWPPVDIPEGVYHVTLTLYHASGQVLPVRTLVEGEVQAREQWLMAEVYHPPDVYPRQELGAPWPEPDHALRAAFGDDVALVGYDAEARIAPGDALRIALYWHALRPVPEDYKVFIHVVSSEGQLVAQDDSKPVYWFYPTMQWQPGEIIRDEHVLNFDPDVPRGDFDVVVGMYDPETGARVSVQAEGGAVLPDQRVWLYQLQVR